MPVTLTGASTSYPALAARIRAGEADALMALVERDHSVATFFAEAVGTPHLAPIWTEHVRRIMDGSLVDGLRCVLLAAIYAARDHALETACEPPGRVGSFVGVGDRWEGWWTEDGEPLPWPDDFPGPADAIAGLRRIPFGLRALLVLREVAELTPDETARVLGDASHQAVDLDDARDAYLSALDQEVAARGRA